MVRNGKSAEMGHRLLKTFGLVLIALPEPFTTPFGVALLLLAHFLFRKHRPDSYNRLRELVRGYLNHFRAYDYNKVSGGAVIVHTLDRNLALEEATKGIAMKPWVNQRTEPREVVFHTLNWNLLSETTSSEFQDSPAIQSESSLKVVYHALDYNSLRVRFKDKLQGYWGVQSSDVDKVVHHNLKRIPPVGESARGDLCGYWFSQPVRKEKVIHHKLDKARMRQHREAAAALPNLKQKAGLASASI